MMPDLGKYAGPVLWSYGLGLAILAIVVLLSVWQSRRVQRSLAEVEARAGKSDV
jgi:heme exporter protein D